MLFADANLAQAQVYFLPMHLVHLHPTQILAHHETLILSFSAIHFLTYFHF